ncbi:MAG: hypothetical protein Q9162_000936 [Coniocarpon cinnabarinum]
MGPLEHLSIRKQASNETLDKTGCRVYKVQFTQHPPDPDMQGPRYHTVVFVETKDDGSGLLHHVTGELVKGMAYQRQFRNRVEDSGKFHAKQYLGRVDSRFTVADVGRVCEAETPPGPQKKFNIKKMRHEPVKPDGSFYTEGEQRQPLIKCTEWTENQVIPKLFSEGIIDRNASESGPASASGQSSGNGKGHEGGNGKGNGNGNGNNNGKKIAT